MGTTNNKEQQSPILNNTVNNPHFPAFVEKLCNEAPNGSINKNYYETIMKKLESFQIITLAGTPLGDRLFNHLSSGTTKINAQAFSHCILELAKNKEKRVYLTFKLYQSKSGLVTQKEFVKFMEECWLAAFLLLENKNSSIEPSLVYQWAKKQSMVLEKHSNALFQKYDIMKTGYLDEQSFKQFVMQENIKVICAKYEDAVVEVPITLIRFQK